MIGGPGHYRTLVNTDVSRLSHFISGGLSTEDQAATHLQFPVVNDSA